MTALLTRAPAAPGPVGPAAPTTGADRSGYLQPLAPTCAHVALSRAVPRAPEPADADRALCLLIVSALAENASVLSCQSLDVSADRVYTVMRRTLMRLSHPEVMAWRQRTPASVWLVSWDAARHAARVFYRHVPGIHHVPDLHALDEGAWALPDRY